MVSIKTAIAFGTLTFDLKMHSTQESVGYGCERNSICSHNAMCCLALKQANSPISNMYSKKIISRVLREGKNIF